MSAAPARRSAKLSRWATEKHLGLARQWPSVTRWDLATPLLSATARRWGSVFGREQSRQLRRVLRRQTAPRKWCEQDDEEDVVNA